MIGMILFAGIVGATAVAVLSRYAKHIISFVKDVVDLLRRNGIISEGFETFINKVSGAFQSIVVSYYKTQGPNGDDQWNRKTTTENNISPNDVPDHIRNKSGQTNTTNEVREEMERIA